MPRTRTTRKDCEDRIRMIEGPLLVELGSRVDEVLTEEDLKMMLAERLGGREKLQHRKFPDCTWHKKTCRYVVVELKSGSLAKALRQLRNFARNFPDIHSNVEFYVIEVKSSSKELKRYMRLEPVKGRPGLYRAMRNLKKHRVPWDIDGKELLIRKV